MVKKTDIALLLGLGIVGFILFSQLKNIQFPSFQFPQLPSISETVSTTQKPSSITTNFLARFDPLRSITPRLEIQRIQQEAPSFNVFDSVRQAIDKITTGGFSAEFFERVAAVSPITQSGAFVQQVDVFGRPIRSF